MEHVIEIRNLTKSYGKNRGVIDVSFTVEPGDIFGFLGPNGAGKSTIIRSMLGFIHYEQGEISLFGEPVGHLGSRMFRQIGYMPSEAWFYPGMTVADTLKFAADMHQTDASEEARMLCERLQVDTGKKIRELSLGNRKKVSIICAMQHKPQLFVFDEPTSGLDPLMQAEFFRLIGQYVAAGATCLLSTHVLSEVKNHCNRIAIMKEGRLRKIDTTEHLMRTGAKRIRMLRDGVEVDYMYTGDLNELYKELEGHDIGDILIEDPSLEDVFMHYYEV